MGKAKATEKDVKGQRTLFGFFSKADMTAAAQPAAAAPKAAPSQPATKKPPTPPLTGKKASAAIEIGDSPVKAGPSKAAAAASKKQPAGPITPPPTSEAARMLVDTKDDEEEEEEAVSQTRPRNGKRPIIEDSDSEVEPPVRKAGPVKRQRTSTADSTFEAPARASSDDDDDEGDFIVPDDEDDAPRASTSKAKARAKAAPKSNGSLKAPAMGRNPSSSSSTSFMKTAAQQAREATQQLRRENEVSFEFLRPDVIRDADRHRPDHPDYDARTLFIPDKDFAKLSPFEQQFWDIKRNHMNTVLFFQKGKFYELYEEDASIGHREFDLKLTDRVKMRMVGVPETSFDFWAAKFLARGYRVGRVDQAETAIGMEMRQKADKGKSKPKGKDIVQRELRSVITNGTQTENLTEELSKHCIAIVEHIAGDRDAPVVGVCVLDASTASFRLAHFIDDASRTKLDTLIRQCRATELVHVKNRLSAPTIRILRAALPTDCQWVAVKPTERKAALEHLQSLLAEAGDRDEEEAEGAETMKVDGAEEEALPTAVEQCKGQDEVISAMGCLLGYLREINLDAELVTTRHFAVYDPMRDGQRLVLDGQTLAHIEVLQNSHGGEEGTLLRLLSRCITPFGKRLFKLWLCQPLRSVTAINDRLDAVDDLMACQEFGAVFDTACKSIPDLERLISRIHAGSCKPRDFVKVLKAFRALGNLLDQLVDIAKDFKAEGIRRLLSSVPPLEELVTGVEAAFEQPGGENTDLIPLVGADEDYDAAMGAIEEIEDELKQCLKRYRRELDDTSIQFRDIGIKDIYQIQCPVKLKVPHAWTQMSSTKEFKRWYSPEVEKLVRKLKEARETKTAAVQQFKGRLYAQFDRHYRSWLRAVETIAQVDCLLSLSKSSAALAEPRVRPELVEADIAMLEFEELRHPCVFSATSDFIPNDVAIGGEERNMVLLTGPNMAGKSTLLRMTSTAVIMAQLGCYVPAAKARIAPCDRINTRMGANDHIFSSASTFKVEMDDCKKILSEATPRSLVILDELGRGTSTWDGMAIAYSVLHHLATHIGCIGFFATHYSSLVKDVAYHPQIRPGHMATQVEGDDAHEVVFLYKLQDGATTKSYGPSVARMAGLDEGIVKRAMDISKGLEASSEARMAAATPVTVGLPLPQQADFAWLAHAVQKGGFGDGERAQVARTLDIIRSSLLTAS